MIFYQKNCKIQKKQKDNYLLDNSGIIFFYFKKKKNVRSIDINKKKFCILFLIQIKK